MIWLKKTTWIRSLPKTGHMSKHDELISTPLVGKVRHQIKRANFDGVAGSLNKNAFFCILVVSKVYNL